MSPIEINENKNENRKTLDVCVYKIFCWPILICHQGTAMGYILLGENDCGEINLDCAYVSCFIGGICLLALLKKKPVHDSV